MNGTEHYCHIWAEAYDIKSSQKGAFQYSNVASSLLLSFFLPKTKTGYLHFVLQKEKMKEANLNYWNAPNHFSFFLMQAHNEHLQLLKFPLGIS